MEELHLDFETRGASDLKTEGADKYALTADILCASFAFDDEPVTVVPLLREPALMPKRVLDHVERGGTVIAHNAPFEYVIWNGVNDRLRLGWPYLSPDQMDCTMARAFAMSLPGMLEGAAAALGIDMHKDMAGHRVMLKLSQPRKILPDGTVTWWEPEEFPEEFKKLYAYGGQDVNVERAIHKRLLPLSSNECKVWRVDFAINRRGIWGDVEPAKSAQLIIEQETDRLNARIRALTNDEVSTCKANIRLKEWLNENGVETPGVAKNDITRLLASPSLPRHVRDVLLIRQEAAKSSTAKLKSILARADDRDQRLRGLFQYHAASTGRFGGRGPQPHNFPRPKLRQKSIEEVFALLSEHGSAARDDIESFFGPPMTVLSDCLRGFLCAKPGSILYALDYSAIEARVLAWLAAEERVLEIFRGHGKIYEHAAAITFGLKVKDITESSDERQIGKVEVLALGFEGGVGAFLEMCRTYGVKIETIGRQAERLWSLSPNHRRERAKWGWEKRGQKTGLGKREWMACELIKLAWREAHPNIVRFWKDLNFAAMAATCAPGRAFEAGKVSFKVLGSFLFCKLPSGRLLAYPYPEVVEEEVKDDDGKVTGTRKSLRYKTEDSEIHKWVRVATYGGKLAENVTQAVARDLLCETMLEMEAADFPVVLHVHDEVVCEVDDEYGTLFDRFDDFMALGTKLPAWAEGLPMNVKGWQGKRYRKG